MTQWRKSKCELDEKDVFLKRVTIQGLSLS